MLSNTFSPVLAIAEIATQPVELSAAAVFVAPSLLYAVPGAAGVVGPGVFRGAVRDGDPAPSLFAGRSCFSSSRSGRRSPRMRWGWSLLPGPC
jgi:hypothetical protein